MPKISKESKREKEKSRHRTRPLLPYQAIYMLGRKRKSQRQKNNEQKERLARNASDGRIIKHANPQVHEVKMGKIKPPSLSVHDILKRGTPVMIVKKWERK